MSDLRIPVRVRPGAARAGVGGSVAGRLLVRVTARAVDGKATEAALRAVADALDVRPSAVRLVHGATSRDKLVEVSGDPAVLATRVAALTADPSGDPDG